MGTEKNEPWKHVPRTAETKAKISASMRGKNRGNGNARKPREQHRVHIGLSVAPETLAALKAYAETHGVSMGKAMDALVFSAPQKVRSQIRETGKSAD